MNLESSGRTGWMQGMRDSLEIDARYDDKCLRLKWLVKTRDGRIALQSMIRRDREGTNEFQD